jgi:protein TonB
MTRQMSTGELIALRPGQGRTDDLHGAAVPVRAERARSSAIETGADLGNVVPFVRPRGGARAPLDVVPPTDAARLVTTGSARERVRLAAFAALSLGIHAGLFMAFWREPVPLASIGVEAISLEIVVGATAPAGIAITQGEQLVNSAAAPDPQPADPQREPETQATEQPPEVQVAAAESAPEEMPAERPAEPPKPQELETAVDPEPANIQPKPAIAMVESPKPEEATAKPQEIAPDTAEMTLLPKPKQAAPPKPIRNVAPAREPRRLEAPTRERAAQQANAAAPSTAANNIGVGRSDNATNYAGLVSAHLRRHQQYPAEARSRGDQGTATVSFSLDGGGRVTSARLARGSGIAIIDQEVQAMVRRASPFPAPPGGRAQSFTVPVSFRLN